MFTSAAGSPYGALGLLNAGNNSSGQGQAGFPTPNVPMPSGGLGNVSVYNKSLDTVQNDVPSRLFYPSSNEAISLAREENDLRLNDFVFVLLDGTIPENLESRFKRLGANEVSMVSLPMVNAFIRQKAEEYITKLMKQDISENDIRNLFTEQDKDGVLQWQKGVGTPFLGKGDNSSGSGDVWWQVPEMVAEWCVPMGSVLNMMQMQTYGGGGEPHGHAASHKLRRAINVVCSRRANVKNNFYSVHDAQTFCDSWSTQSMGRVAVQYSVESMKIPLFPNLTIPIVQLSMLYLDNMTLVSSPGDISELKQAAEQAREARDEAQRTLSDGYLDASYKQDLEMKQSALSLVETELKLFKNHVRDFKPDSSLCISRSSKVSRRDHPTAGSFERFSERPLASHECRVIVPIGRVLHSALHHQTAHECLVSCFQKSEYDKLKPMEIELGCP
jgi:hypothetical protein